MRETENSLRAYFTFIAVLQMIGVGIMISSDEEVIAVAIAGVMTAIVIFCAVRFKHLLQNSPGVLSGLVLAVGGLSVLGSVIEIATGQPTASYLGLGIGVLITGYLYVNIQRLAKETGGQDIAKVFD